ncbi:MAG: ROK family transcriptional regulator [Bacteroidota bacterium]
MPELSLQIAEEKHKLALKLIRDYGELSGARIARSIGLQPSTVMYILRRLHNLGFIEYSRTGDSTKRGGKKPVLWKISGSFAYVLGMEVLVDKIRYVLTDFSGKIIARRGVPYENYLKNDHVSEAILENIKEVIEKNFLETNKILGIGIGITGLIDNIPHILFSEYGNYSVAMGANAFIIRKVLG